MQISETDAQRLFVGMPASVRIHSLRNATYSAKVAKIDPIAKSISRNSKVKKVEVLVELDSTSQEVRPGLTVTAEIYVKRATNVLSVPQVALFASDSAKIVYVKEKSHYVPRPVATLYQDEDFVIVYGDLADGELLALREPPNTRISWPDVLAPLQAPIEADTFKVAKREPPPDRRPGARMEKELNGNGLSVDDERLWIQE
ncbi:hypothetical protein EH222_13695 [candidate division KSB1 bacterium]|nr:MAG: hypothetical protein EH222_13695 [candidate division KSB1 bacterium]